MPGVRPVLAQRIRTHRDQPGGSGRWVTCARSRASATPATSSSRTWCPCERAARGRSAAPADVRLAGLAVGTWLTVLAGLHLGARTVLLLAGAAAGLSAAGALHLLGHLGLPPATVRHCAWTAVAVGLGVVCGAAATGGPLGRAGRRPSPDRR
ncbi:hypothetical protein ACFOW4_18285 [Micromonospora sp. GCM10011542]|uniref:hypothetical protein n=1 Tax=Micromonospora sp. GCM10011542 TaxID=3317337 RepID=UPI003617024B